MGAIRVLVADCNEVSAEISAGLAGQPIEVSWSSSEDGAREILDNGAVDVLILGRRPGADLSPLRGMAAQGEPLAVILLGDTDVGDELEPLSALFVQVVSDAMNGDDLRLALAKALAYVARLRDAPPPLPLSPGKMIGSSAAMKLVMDLLGRAAPGNATILIRGESGTGKELVAREIHRRSPRAGERFHKIDCTSLPETLLESELFGHERGAFTGAVTRKKGRVELANRGTLFLDEIGDISPALQAKLLRLLQDREFERVGGNDTLKIDVRVVAATHRDLEAMVREGAFRTDLFYRLNVVPLWLPPLRARREDIESLAVEFCRRLAQANGRGPITLDPGAVAVLRAHRWPGNVRQLENFVERMVVLADGPRIMAEEVHRLLSEHDVRFPTQSVSSGAGASSPAPDDGENLDATLRAAERKAITAALEKTRGSRTQAARLLGIGRSTLYNKMVEHALLSDDS